MVSVGSRHPVPEHTRECCQECRHLEAASRARSRRRLHMLRAFSFQLLSFAHLFGPTYFTTTLTNLCGTTITFTTSWPSMKLCTLPSASAMVRRPASRSEEHTSELQSR